MRTSSVVVTSILLHYCRPFNLTREERDKYLLLEISLCKKRLQSGHGGYQTHESRSGICCQANSLLRMICTRITAMLPSPVEWRYILLRNQVVTIFVQLKHHPVL